MSFALVLFVVLIIAGAGLYGMSQMSNAISLIHSENSVKVKQANLAFHNVNNVSCGMRLVPYTSGTDAFAAVEEQVLQSRGR